MDDMMNKEWKKTYLKIKTLYDIYHYMISTVEI